MNPYEDGRAQYRDAGIWDRVVRRIRATERLRAQGSKDLDLEVQERAGVLMLVDTQNPERIEAL